MPVLTDRSPAPAAPPQQEQQVVVVGDPNTDFSRYRVEPHERGPHFDRLLRWLVAHRRDQPILSYPDTEGAYHVRLTCADLERVTAYGAARYAEAFRRRLPPNGNLAALVPGGVGFQGVIETPVVAVLSTSTLASNLTFLALQRLGLSTMSLSPRLAEAGYAHLLRTTDCHTVLAAGPALDVMRRVQTAYSGPLHLFPMLDDDEFLAGLAAPPVALPPPLDTCNPGLILHTGGTTGLPKPVAFDVAGWLANIPLQGPIPGPLLCTVPIFHLYGLGTLVVSLLRGVHLCLLNPHRPVTASIVWRALDATGVFSLFTVPYTLKFFADIEGGLERLAALSLVRAGGAATPEDLGNLLIRNGVKLTTMYGQTESGATLAQYGLGLGDWNWLTPTPMSEKFVKFEKVADDMYHLVVLPGWPSLKLSDRPDGSYGTKDLFRPHPENLPGNDTRAGKARWKFVARQGDIVVLANGENADPSPIEQAVLLDPHVQMCIAFSLQERLGLLVIPSDKARGMTEAEVVRALLPALAHGNALVSDYAKISPDDIVVKPVGTPYPQTAKMTLQRHVLTQLFADDIERCAARGGVGAGANKKIISDEEIYGVVKCVVVDQFRDSVVGPSSAEANNSNGTSKSDGQADIEDEADFFTLGMDSLQSSLVRRRLEREIPLPSGVNLAINVVFEYPTVRQLSEHIKSLRQAKAGATNGSLGRDGEAIAKAMVKKYSTWGATANGQGDSVATTPAGEENGVNGQVIVLTGATGYIGVQILNTLLNRPGVSRVYCLVRARDHAKAAQRIQDALANSQLWDGLAPGSRAKLRCLGANLAAAGLGLSPAEHDEIHQAGVTAIIHNAWAVNFNMSLESFEPNVASVYHLLNLGRRGSSNKKKTPTFVFISSIAAVGTALRRGTAAEERMYDWHEAAPVRGYGESKWAAEQICASASALAGYRGPVRILRVGQVSGDTRHGIWNSAEAIPALVQSALTIGALPRMTDRQRNTLCWLPSDAAGSAIVDLTMLDTTTTTTTTGSFGEGSLAVFHVASPHTLRWNEDVLPAAAKAGLPPFREVPQQEWVRLLSESDKDIEKNPPYKLIEHFRLTYGSREENGSAEGGFPNGKDGEETARLDLAQALKYSPALRDAPVVDSALLVRYVKFWLRYWGAENKSLQT